MIYTLTWLPDVLLSAGLKVAEVPGWETRGRGDVGRTLGVLCHHTAGPRRGNMPSLFMLRDGRFDLPGPLSQLGLGRDGTYYVIAAGKAHHAGRGLWRGITSGNLNFIGIEAENTGTDETWPAVQLDAYHRGVAAILLHAGLSADRCAGHREYALPRGRKIDPNLDMSQFRREVAKIMAGEKPIPLPIPQSEPSPSGRPTLRRGSRGDSVRLLQRAFGEPETGIFDALLEARVREFQRESQLVPDGIFGPKSWAALDRLLLARTNGAA